LQNNFDSSQRSHGIWAAHEIINRIRANVMGRENGNYIRTNVDPCNTIPASCVNNTCNANAMAAFDIFDAVCQDSLLNPIIDISCTDSDASDGFTCTRGSDFTLTLQWDSKAVADDSDIASSQVAQQFQQVFQP